MAFASCGHALSVNRSTKIKNKKKCVKNKATLWAASYSAYVVYTKTITYSPQCR